MCVVSKIAINISFRILYVYTAHAIALAHATHSGPLAGQRYCACGCDPTVEGECECVLPVVIDCRGSNIIARRLLVGRVNGGLSNDVKVTGAELIVVL